MKQREQKQTETANAMPKPYRIRLPGFVSEEDVGLGDAIHRATSYLGIRHCSGCERRAAAMNRWIVFTRRDR